MTDKYSGNTRAAKAIYGIILSFVLLYGIDHLGITNPISISIKLLLGALSITFAEIYAETIGERIAKKRKLDNKEKRQIIDDAMAIVSVSAMPVIFFLVAAIEIISLDTAYILAYCYFLCGLFIFNYYAGLNSRASRRNALLFAIAATAVGVLAIAVKYAFGH